MPTLLSAENRRRLIDLMADLPNLRARSTREATLYRADLARHARHLLFDATPLDFCTELVQRLDAANTLPPLFDYLIADEFPGRPEIITFLRGLLPTERPPAPMGCYVNKGGIDLDGTDYRLLLGAAVHSRIALVKQLGEGKSRALV